MVNIWHILGIDPTTDRRGIKRAYALKLKRVHPEDDPDGFRTLRSAYEKALSWGEDHEERQLELFPAEGTEEWNRLFEALKASLQASRISSQRGADEEPKVVAPTTGTETSRGAGVGPRFPVPTAEQRRDEEHRVARAVASLMREVKVLQQRKADWFSESAWAAMLDRDVLWDLDVRRAFQAALFGFLGSTKPTLSHHVWLLLDRHFQWAEVCRDFYRSLGASEVDWVLERIHTARRRCPTPTDRADSNRPGRRVVRLDDEREVLSLLPESMASEDLLFLLIVLLPFIQVAISGFIALFCR